MKIHYSQTRKLQNRIREVCSFGSEVDVATFTPPSQGNTRSSVQSAGTERPRSAWDELRAKAERNKPQQEQQEKKESVWGDDK